MLTDQIFGRRSLLPVILGLGLACNANAYELVSGSDGYLNLDISGAAGIFHSDKRYNMDGATDATDMSWREAYLEYGISFGYHSQLGRWEGALTALSSGTWGDGDAAGFSTGSERESELEQAWVRWSSGELFSALGEDAVVLSVGRQSAILGDGFILGTDMISMGRGLGDEFDRGGAYYLGGRTAFDRTAIVSLGGTEGWRGDVMWLESDNPFQADMELAVANLEHVGDKATVGLSAIKGLDADQRYAQALGREERDGMKVYSLRGQGNAGVEQLFLSGEYAHQRLSSGNENAWYLEGGWTFTERSWQPALTYRYSQFSSGYDPLFYGFTRGFGTWYQGEVAANYGGPFSSNARVHHLGLLLSPRDDLTLGFAAFDFATRDRDAGDMSGQELDVYAEWTLSEHLSLIPLVGLFSPDKSASEGGTQLGGRGDNLYAQLLMFVSF